MAALLFTGSALAAENFEQASLRLEQNFTDKDVEVVFTVTTEDAGIATLQVTAPDGRMVIDFKSPRSKFGIRHLELETPEPVNDGKLQADFPEGTYRFIGTTTSGAGLQATAVLNHMLPPAVEPVSPRPGQKDVPISGATVQWKTMTSIAQFIVILEDGKSGQEIQARLSGTKNAFSVPPGFLSHGGKYKVEIGAVAENGNRTFMEYTISTADRP